MRLKDLLLESSQIEKLEKFLSGEKYNLREPYIWRGRHDREEDVLEKESYGMREPMSTRAYIDYFVDEFTKECFSQFPRRRVSRFGATNKEAAENYGTHIYLIIPSKDAKVAYLDKDSYSLFDDADRSFKYGRDYLWYNKPEFYDPDGEERMKRVKELFSEEIINILQSVKIAYNWNIMRMSVDITDYGCPIDISRKLAKRANEISNTPKKKEDGAIKNGLEKIAEGFYYIHQYFDRMETGYPEPNSGEVVYDGEYLQIHEDLFEKYRKKRGDR